MSDHNKHLPSKDDNKAVGKAPDVDPATVARFTRGQGTRAKTEAKDAKDTR